MRAAANIDRLRWCATGILVLAFLTAGCKKIVSADAGLTMVGRYLPTPNAVRAMGCMEVAVGLWLLSGRSPRVALGMAGVALAGLTLLIGVELSHDSPLACGCMPVWLGTEDVISPQRSLWIAAARNGFLIGLCLLAGMIAPNFEPSERVPSAIAGKKLSENLYRR